ncbi:Sim4 and Mal2 associated protein 1 [Schizosaccharomyces octosporus yFS286]|uniref:Sim4 and Mal2 associated protein 1 n=1 Tax=Schizosaccharomyces octosporus (strain yFS286) TaxID=483514 RepID=S9RFT5_SCHOY|nr:Sim4 and Mal2 associated protein 1 [Schizosaccharomyces octosporus yFS286]EPX72939.1 Sim4 and Mal2 associated protein 1 [Schizosaccharomyces octosporus yFS286]
MSLQDHQFFNTSYTAYQMSPLFKFDSIDLSELSKKLQRYLKYGSTRGDNSLMDVSARKLNIESALFLELERVDISRVLKLSITYSTTNGTSEVKRLGQAFFFGPLKESDSENVSSINTSEFTQFPLLLVRMDGKLWHRIEDFLKVQFDVQIIPRKLTSETLLKIFNSWELYVKNTVLSMPIEFTWSINKPNLSNLSISIRAEDCNLWMRSSSSPCIYDTFVRHIKRCTSIDLTHHLFAVTKIVMDSGIMTASGKVKFFSNSHSLLPTILYLIEYPIEAL